MAGARNNVHARRRARHSLCPLESCKEGEFCPHAVHMALRVEDGMEGDALNARAGCHQRIERRRHTLTVREGLPEAGELLGVSSTRLAPSGKENFSDPTMIGYNHSSHKINPEH